MASSVAVAMPELDPAVSFLRAGAVLESPGNHLVSPFAAHPPDAILNLQHTQLDQELALDQRQNSIDPALRSITLDAAYVVRMVSAHTGASMLTDATCSTNNRDSLHISMGMSGAGPASSEFLPLLPEDFLRVANLASVEDGSLPVIGLTPPPTHNAAAAKGTPLLALPLKRAASCRIDDNDSFEFTQPPCKLTAPHTTLPASPRATLRGFGTAPSKDPTSPRAMAEADTATSPAHSQDVTAAAAWNAGLPYRPVGWNPRLQGSLDINRQRRGNRRSIASLDEAVGAAGVTAALAAVAISKAGSGSGAVGRDLLDQCGPRDSLESWLEDEILAEAHCWLP